MPHNVLWTLGDVASQRCYLCVTVKAIVDYTRSMGSLTFYGFELEIQGERDQINDKKDSSA